MQPVADNSIESEPLVPPRKNIPGTDIPDEGIPEDARRRGLGPTPHENEELRIHGAQVPKENPEPHPVQPFLPNDIRPPGITAPPVPVTRPA